MTALHPNLPETQPVAPQRHLMWLGAGLLVGFAVPFVFTDLLTLPRNLYYAIYAIYAVGFFVLWSRSTQSLLQPWCADAGCSPLSLGWPSPSSWA